MSYFPQSRSYSCRSVGSLLLVGVLAGVVLGGGVGVFAAASSSSVTVCADKSTNVLRYAKNGKCVKTETKVVLNQTGATGAKGSAGAKGDTGSPGTNATLAITQQSVCDGADANSTSDELCKVGMTGPGGGLIFFVDYNDQYAGFDYLEAAPLSCEGIDRRWSSDSFNSLAAVSGWAARAVGSGPANTTAMTTNSGSYVADSSGAAFYSDSLICGGKSDWFLGSLGEMKLMYDNLQGLGGFNISYDVYWSSSENVLNEVSVQSFLTGSQFWVGRVARRPVRPVRAF